MSDKNFEKQLKRVIKKVLIRESKRLLIGLLKVISFIFLNVLCAIITNYIIT